MYGVIKLDSRDTEALYIVIDSAEKVDLKRNQIELIMESNGKHTGIIQIKQMKRIN